MKLKMLFLTNKFSNWLSIIFFRKFYDEYNSRDVVDMKQDSVTNLSQRWTLFILMQLPSTSFDFFP